MKCASSGGFCTLVKQSPRYVRILNSYFVFVSPQLSTLTFTHRLFSGPSEHVPAMNRIKSIVASMNFSSIAFAEASEYAGWETDEVISWETVRNLILSMICVLVTTVVLISDLRACLWVLICVSMTLVSTRCRNNYKIYPLRIRQMYIFSLFVKITK